MGPTGSRHGNAVAVEVRFLISFSAVPLPKGSQFICIALFCFVLFPILLVVSWQPRMMVPPSRCSWMSFGTANTRSVVKNFHLIHVCLPSMHSKCQQHICTVGMGSVWRAPLWPPRADSGDREVAEAAAGQQGEGGVGRRRLQAVADALAVGGVPLCCPCIRHDVSGRRVSGFFLLAHPTHPPLGNWRESGGTRVWGFTLGQPSSDWAHFPFPPPWACLTGRLTIPTGPPDDDQPPSR